QMDTYIRLERNDGKFSSRKELFVKPDEETCKPWDYL
ncbi:hypothetical protein TNCT_501001, partial [Trichonephila clavata]